MKTIKLILIILVLGVPVVLDAQVKGPESAKVKEKTWDKLTPYEQAIKSSRVKGSRKITINPNLQKDGIQSGCVIAYGHFMRPPFVVSYADHKLMINGVQVEPSLILERERKMAKPVDEKRLTAARRQLDITQEILEKYRKEKSLKPEAQLKADLLAFAKTKDVVIDAKWDKDAFMVSFLYGTGFEFLPLNIPELPAERKHKTNAELRKEGEDGKIRQVRKVLDSGGCIVFNSSNGQKIMHDPRETVNKIMSSAALSNEEKIQALADKVFLGCYDEPFDVLENYDPKEWLKI